MVTREATLAENVPGGFGIVYPVLKGLEDSGRIRRGYFVAGLGATQFALPGALDLLRSLRETGPADAESAEGPEVAVLAATDPANPYGATLRWPGFAPTGPSTSASAARGPTRSVGATVILVNGALAAYLARGDRQLTTFLPDAEPDRSKTARAVARALIDRARGQSVAPPGMLGMLIEEIDGLIPSQHPLAPFLSEAGYVSGAMGMQAKLLTPLAPDGGRPPSRGRGAARTYHASSVSSPFARRYFDVAESAKPEAAKDDERDG